MSQREAPRGEACGKKFSKRKESRSGASVGRLVIEKPREFGVVKHNSRVVLNRVVIFLLESVAGFRWRKHLARQRNSCMNILGGDRLFARQSFIQAHHKFRNIVQPRELLMINQQPEQL